MAGSAGVGLLFCSIPLGTESYRRAMEELNRHASLKPNQVLANLREDTAYRVYLGFYCTADLTISADILELTPSESGAPAAK